VERQLGRVPTTRFEELPQDALLTPDEVGEWLKIARRQVQRLEIPRIDLGRKRSRYQVKDVLAWLETRRRSGGRPGAHLVDVSMDPRALGTQRS